MSFFSAKPLTVSIGREAPRAFTVSVGADAPAPVASAPPATSMASIVLGAAVIGVAAYWLGKSEGERSTNERLEFMEEQTRRYQRGLDTTRAYGDDQYLRSYKNAVEARKQRDRADWHEKFKKSYMDQLEESELARKEAVERADLWRKSWEADYYRPKGGLY